MHLGLHLPQLDLDGSGLLADAADQGSRRRPSRRVRVRLRERPPGVPPAVAGLPGGADGGGRGHRRPRAGHDGSGACPAAPRACWPRRSSGSTCSRVAGSSPGSEPVPRRDDYAAVGIAVRGAVAAVRRGRDRSCAAPAGRRASRSGWPAGARRPGCAESRATATAGSRRRTTPTRQVSPQPARRRLPGPGTARARVVTMWTWVTEDDVEADRLLREVLAPTARPRPRRSCATGSASGSAGTVRRAPGAVRRGRVRPVALVAAR